MRRLALAVCVLVAGCGGTGSGVPKRPIDLAVVAPAAETFTDADLAHLRFLLTEEQQGQYAAQTPEQRGEMMRVVWAELDPTPTTELNERKLEHYRRLAYVRGHFSNDDKTEWDRRGELLLRYGVPDQLRRQPAEIDDVTGLIPPREVWVYLTLGQAYQLEDPTLQDHFVDAYDIVGDSDVVTPRDVGTAEDALSTDLNPYRRALRTPVLGEGTDAEDALRNSKLDGLLARGHKAIREKPQAFVYDYGGEQLDFVFDVVDFRGPQEGKTRVDINTAFWAGDLKYMPEDGANVAVLGTQAMVRTMDYHDVTRRDQVTRDHKDSVDDLAGRLVLDQLSLSLDPGHYRLALSVTDSLSHNVGIYKTDFWVKPFPEGELRISDIQRSLNVHGGQPGDPFLRGPLQVVPYPLGTFPRDRDIYLYFEAYGLELSPEGDCFYGVDFLIRPRATEPPKWFGSSKGQVVPGVASTFEGTAKSSTVREHIIFDPSTFSDDVYDIEITVHDRISGLASPPSSISFAVQGR